MGPTGTIVQNSEATKEASKRQTEKCSFWIIWIE